MFYTSVKLHRMFCGLMTGFASLFLAMTPADAKTVEHLEPAVGVIDGDPSSSVTFRPLLAIGGQEQSGLADGGRIIRSREVDVDVSAMKAAAARAGERPRISFDLFDDVSVTLVVRDVIHRTNESFSIQAVMPRGMFAGYGMMTVHNGVFTGRITVPHVGVFEIKRKGGRYRVMQIDEQATNLCGVGPQHRVGGHGERAGNGGEATLFEIDPITVNLLVVFTEEALEHELSYDGDLDALVADVQASVAFANTTLANSGLPIDVKLVNIVPTFQYNETDMFSDLANLRDGTVLVSPIATAQNARAQHCAHFLSMMVFYENPPAGGVAYLKNELSPAWAENAVSVLNSSAWGASRTLIHEMGHNMGCHHDHLETGSVGGIFPYSYGHRWIVFNPMLTPDPNDDVYATVMTYPPYTTGIPHFSNPRVEEPAGFPTGIFQGQTGEADNALTIVNTSPFFSLYAEFIGGFACAEQNVYWVPDDFPTIQAAIDFASTRDMIIVRPGVYEENIDFKGKAVHVRSMEPNNPAVISTTIIDGQQLDSVVSFRLAENADSVLQGFTIRNGRANSGGGLYIRNSSPSIANCVVENNEAINFGGGMFAENGGPILHRITFIGNTAAFGAGAYAFDASPAIYESTFTSNAAAVNGGGLYAMWSSPLVDTTDFVSNTAGILGAGVYCQQSTPSFRKVSLTANIAANRGGGVYLHGGDSVFDEVVFENNEAGNSGGGLYGDHGLVTISDSVFENNSSLSRGGAVYTAGGGISFEDTDLHGNQTGFAGGAYYSEFSNYVFIRCFVTGSSASRGGAMDIRGGIGVISHSSLTNNTAGPLGVGHGGGLHLAQTQLNLLHSAVSNNVASVTGGGIYVWTDPDLEEEDWILPTLTGSQICANSPNNIAGPWNNNGGNEICSLDVDIWVPDDFTTIQAAINAANHGDIISVRAGVYLERIDFMGKGVWVRSENADPADTVIDGQGGGSVVTMKSNEPPTARLDGFTVTGGAALHGGGVYVRDSHATIENCIIVNNTATSGGGGMAIFDSSPTVRNNTFLSNTAGTSGSGGGMYIERADGMTLHGCTFQGNHANSLGGGIASLNSSHTALALEFHNNTAGLWGGAMFNGQNGFPSILSSTFTHNSATLGGAIYSASNSSAQVSNSSFCANTPTHVHGPWIDFSGNTFVDICPPANNTPDNPESIFNPETTLVGSFEGATNDGTSSCDPDSVDVFFQYIVVGGPTTLSIDTCGSEGDTALAVFDSMDTELACNTTCAGTPCDAPHACVFLPGLADGTYLIRVSFTPTVAANTGGYTVYLKETKIIGDLNGDAVVDVSDLLILLGMWGECSGCLGDLNGDGAVDVSDLLILLGNWG